MNISFEWDEEKNKKNIKNHRISFEEAQEAFLDPKRLIFIDIDHSTERESRYYCLGKIRQKVCTVRFTYRKNKIRIFGAGYWRKERSIYENQNKK